MYNGLKIKQYLDAQNLRQRDLLDYMGLKENGSIARFTGNDIKASRLEQIADFLGLPIDAFFDREIDVTMVAPVTSGASSKNATLETLKSQKSMIETLQHSLKMEQDHSSDLERIIKEKDERIRILEDMIALLKNPFVPDKFGTNAPKIDD